MEVIKSQILVFVNTSLHQRLSFSPMVQFIRVPVENLQCFLRFLLFGEPWTPVLVLHPQDTPEMSGQLHNCLTATFKSANQQKSRCKCWTLLFGLSFSLESQFHKLLLPQYLSNVFKQIFLCVRVFYISITAGLSGTNLRPLP